MAKLRQEVIKQIVKDLAKGYQCYVHKKTAKLTTIDLTLEDVTELENQKSKLAIVEKKKDDYLKIENISAADRLIIMKDFLDELPDRSIQKQLSNALNRKNPMRNFTQVVQSDMELNQHWINFNAKESQRWVSNFVIDAYNY